MKKDMFEEIRDLGIVLKSHSQGSQSVICPRCSATRKKKTNPSLYVTIFPDHILWKCMHCEWSGGAGNSSSSKTRSADYTKREYKAPDLQAAKDKYTSTLPAEALAYLEKRGISPEVATKNNLWWEKGPGNLCFPFFEGVPDGKGNIASKVVNIKHRKLGSKDMFQEKDSKQIFFGHAEWAKSTNTEIIIVEGEFDKLAFNQIGYWNVVSVPAGAPSKEVDDLDSPKFAFLQHARNLLEKMTRVIIAVDNDASGNVLKNELIKRIGKEKCWVVTFPADCKDANDVLMNMGADVLHDIYNEARPCPIKGLYRVDEFQDDMMDYFNGSVARGLSTGWENLDVFYKVASGEVDIVTGVPNSGKSEWIDAVMVNLAKHDNWRFAIFSPENSKEEHVGKLTEKIVGRSVSPDSDNRMTEGEFVNGLQWVNNKFFFLIADNEKDLPTLDWILEKARMAIVQYGIKGLVIDPYNEIEHQVEKGGSETHYISKFISKIKKFAKTHDIKVWIVAHPAKLQKNKDGDIMVPTPYDIAGSANWVNKADNIVVVHRATGTQNVTEIYIAKVRNKHVGKKGDVTLIYDRETGTYSVPPAEDKSIDKSKRKAQSSYYEKDDGDMRSWG